MNKLSTARQAAIIRALCEGNSVASTCRMVGAAKGTVLTLLRNVGAHGKNHHDRMVRNVPAKRVQLDELWAFVGKKEKRVTWEQKGQGLGDVWTYYALDQDHKLVISYRVGNRDARTTYAFVQDLADRLAGRVQLTSDGMALYRPAVESAFGWWGVDFAQLIKIYGPDYEAGKGRYSPPECIGIEKYPVMGDPDPDNISTSHVERMNLTTRMQVRRFTRLTNAHSKKLENHLHSVALHVMWVNFCRPHSALSKGRHKVTPAMAAGLTDRVWTAEDVLALLDA
ncbi:IS1 family transposase [soil metagenome]